ncbi:MAG: SinI family restriction endonuclease [Aquiluna sp.]|nr:SinI family restriction endonuclease [Aquiluna sp.]
MHKVATRVFEKSAPDFVNELAVIANFLISNPDLAPKPSSGDEFGSENFWESLAAKFIRGRTPRAPLEPSTIPDTMVSIIVQEYFGVESDSIAKAAKQHSISMAAENIVGDLLERYLASNLEAYGWVWCSGEVVKKVDFLAAKKGQTSQWVPLQIKNRDNSENSSSSSVRKGTEIIKWFRTFSRTGRTNWDAFPELIDNVSLSEKAFEEFVRHYLRELKS